MAIRIAAFRGRIGELLAGEVFDFLAHDADAALVRGVELQDAGGE